MLKDGDGSGDAVGDDRGDNNGGDSTVDKVGHDHDGNCGGYGIVDLAYGGDVAEELSGSKDNINFAVVEEFDKMPIDGDGKDDDDGDYHDGNNGGDDIGNDGGDCGGNTDDKDIGDNIGHDRGGNNGSVGIGDDLVSGDVADGVDGFDSVVGADDLFKTIVEDVAAVKQYSDDVDKIRMMLSDVSGQSVFYDLHSLFLTPHSICLLVVDLSKPLHGKAEPLFVNFERGIQIPLENYLVETNLDYGNRWMAMLDDVEKTRDGSKNKSSGEKKQISRFPPTILVLTKPDKLSGSPDEVKKKIEEAKVIILGSFTSKGYRPRILKTCVIDNTKSQGFPQGGQLVELREAIFDTAQKILIRQEKVPISLLQFERALATLMITQPYIKVEEAQHLGKRLKMNDDQVTQALNLLHQQNIIVHFDDDESESSLVVLNPRWLVKLFTEVITVPPPEEQMGDQAILWQNLTKRGVLSSELLDVALQDHGKEKKALLKLMERAHLMCHWKDGVYLVPSMVKPSKKNDAKQLLSDSLLLPSLFIDFRAKYVPMGFYTRLQSEFIRWSKGSDDMPNLSCKIGRFFQVEDGIPFSVVLFQHISRIQIALISENISVTQQKVAEIATKVKSFLVKAIENIKNAHRAHRDMEYDLAVKCDVCCDEKVECERHNEEACPDDDCIHLWRLEQLKDDPVGKFCNKVVFSGSSVFDVGKVRCWMDETDSDNQVEYKDSEEHEMSQQLKQIDSIIQWWDTKGPSCDKLRKKLETDGREDVIFLLDKVIRSSKYTNILVRDLDPQTRHQICMKLDVKRSLSGGYRDLAGKIGFSSNEIDNLELKGSPTSALLQHWESNNEATVKRFMHLLRLMKRHDVLDVLVKALRTAEPKGSGCGR